MPDERESLRRSDFLVHRTVATRWADQDAYGHLNNAVHYSIVDTAINGWLLETAGVDTRELATIGLVAETSCRYFAEVQFPQVVTVGLRLAHLGTSSVKYELGLFADLDSPAAVVTFVHVYVDRVTRRPSPIPAVIRAVLVQLGPARDA